MLLKLVFLGAFVALVHSYETLQVQMPEADALMLPDEDLASQVQTLQRNITELWTYIHSLRGAITTHLNHLRQHQGQLETSVYKLEHMHEGSASETHDSHTDSHHHSGERHSHSGEHHSHTDDHHSHSGEEHSHSGEQHQHSGEYHSHGGEQQSHSDDYHSHGGIYHGHDSHGGDHSHSHSHSHSGHSESDSHHDHKDSHESQDDLQQVSQVAEPLMEPVVVASGSHAHSHHGSHHSSSSSSSSSTVKPLQLLNVDFGSHHDHHHHGSSSSPGPAASQTRNRTSRVVTMPKYSEYDLYTFAVCNVHPNRAIPSDQQQDVTGQISLWQKRMGGPLNIHVRLQGFKMSGHHGAHQAIQQEVDSEVLDSSGHKHGIHVHTNGDLSNGCQSTGPHYNPKNAHHGGPNALVRHVGDLGKIECDDHGMTNIVFSDDVAALKEPYSIVGKSLVIHSSADDYGLGGDEESLKTGNAGVRIACCVIEKVEKLPIRSYKAIKSASQYHNR